MIGYDPSIAKSNGSEESLIAAIKAQPSWARIVPNLYLAKTTLTPAKMRDQLAATAGTNKIIVYDVTNQLWAGQSFTPDVRDWIQTNWRQT